MSAYLDTSAVVAFLAKEAMADDIARTLARVGKGGVFISLWCITEFSAALTFKLNNNTLTPEDRLQILTAFREAQEENLIVLDIDADDFERAAIYANQKDLRLRGGDALHLAVAARHNLPILTLDRRMAGAAETLGLGLVRLVG